MRVVPPAVFTNKLYEKSLRKRIPLRAMIELTYTCNHNCLHCYRPNNKNKKELLKEEVCSIIDQLSKMGTLYLTFSGGEIFTRSDVLDIILYARKQGFRVSLMTNGSLLTEKIADTLIAWGVRKFEISVLGANKETFERMTRVAGSFERVIAVIQMLRAKGIIPYIKACVTTINLGEITKIADLAKKLNVSFSYSPFVIPALDLRQGPASLMISPEDLLHLRNRFTPYGRSKAGLRKTDRRRNKIERFGFWEKDCLFDCAAGHNIVFINPNGKMKACLLLCKPSYDVRRGSVKEGWEKIKEFVDGLKPPSDWKCLSCEYHDWCSWCPARAYANTGEIFGCPPYFRELARIRKEKYQKSRQLPELSK